MSEIIHITDSTFPEQVAASELPVFVDFWAPGAVPAACSPRVSKRPPKSSTGAP